MKTQTQTNHYLYSYVVAYIVNVPISAEPKQSCEESTPQHTQGQVVPEVHPLSYVTTVI